MAGVLALAAFAWLHSRAGDDAHVCLAPDAQDASRPTAAQGEKTSSTEPPAAASSVQAAFDFLDRQMDLYHRSMVIQAGPGFSTYYPSGQIGDVANMHVAPDLRETATQPSLRIDYRPGSSGEGWAGLYFLYPDGNWGRLRGRNLSGATKISFSACANHATRAEFFAGGIHDPNLPYADSLSRVSTGVVAVGPSWQRYEIDLKGRDLSSVIGGFGVVTNRDQDSAPRSLFLRDISIDLPKLDEPRFVQSYVPGKCAAGGFPNSAETYDQALALLAFLARGHEDDLRRAELIARALVIAQQNDRTFKDGRLRNAYASGELLDPRTGKTRLPGRYDPDERKYLEDENAAGTDTGNMAWAGLALVQADALLPKREGRPYLNAALSIARWIVTNTRVDDDLGGFSAGVQGFERAAGVPEGQERKSYRSTEHNMDLDAFFEHLADAAGRETDAGKSWLAQADHARTFVDKMRNGATDSSHFWTGTTGATAINKSVIPLDAQTWAVLHTRQPKAYEDALDWALGHCTAKGATDAFDFNCNDGDGAWWEGTGQVVAALRWLKRDQQAAPLLARLRGAQIADGDARGAMPAASICGLTTGFNMSFRSGKTIPWLYPDWPHVGATAWLIFAELGVDPYFVAAHGSSGS